MSLISISYEIDNSDGVFSIINNLSLTNFIMCKITQNGLEFNLSSDKRNVFNKKDDELLEDPLYII